MSAVLSRLHQLSRRNRLPHALLFLGHHPSDLQEAALSLSKHLMCENEPEKRPCLTCRACKKVSELNHPDVFWVRPEKQELTIEQIRELHVWLNRGPFEAKRKIGIVEQADSMNNSASNSLLKILEEPPSHANLVLLSSTSDSLLPTLRSRVQFFRFPSTSNNVSAINSPKWMEDLERILKLQNKLTPHSIFELTDQISKDRDLLPFFFERILRHLKNEILKLQTRGETGSKILHLDTIFDQFRLAEKVLVGRYGNISLTLDPIFLKWLR